MIISESDAPTIKLALLRGYIQHDIAAYYGENQGRISEINTGKLFQTAPLARVLPPDFPPLRKKPRSR